MSVLSESPIRCTCARYVVISRSNCDSAAARPGAFARIVCDLMYPIFTGVCATAVAAPNTRSPSATAPARAMPAMITPSVEIAEPEMELPPGIRTAQNVRPIEAVGPVQTEGAQRRDE